MHIETQGTIRRVRVTMTGKEREAVLSDAHLLVTQLQGHMSFRALRHTYPALMGFLMAIQCNEQGLVRDEDVFFREV